MKTCAGIQVFFKHCLGLLPRTGEMKLIVCSYLLPKWARWAFLTRSGFPELVAQVKKFLLANTLAGLLALFKDPVKKEISHHKAILA